MSNAQFNVDVKGFPELKAKIEQLSSDKSKKTEILAILRQVAGSTVRVAKTFAPVSKRTHVARGQRIQPMTLKRSIGTITGKKGGAVENPTIYVGARAKGGNKGWYAHFVEEDTNVYAVGHKRKKRSKGANIGSGSAVKVKSGQHFLKRAYEATGGQVSAEATEKVARFIQKRIDRLS